MTIDRHPYDNDVYGDNVYGHALELLRRSKHVGDTGDGRSIHLDLGCGFGRIAEFIRDEFRIGYLGIDGDTIGPASLVSRGFDAHQLWFDEFEPTLDRLRALIGDRRVASITMLDTLEHLSNGETVLSIIQAIAREHDAPVVISVPNVTHRDIGFKLAFGAWDYTEAGLLDHTHLQLFSNKGLDRHLRRAGLYTIDSDDVDQVQSDQHFPGTHPALARGTHLSSFMEGLRQNANGFSVVNQFVRLCIAGPRDPQPSYAVPSPHRRPFLSIVTRTQGRRPHTLREVFVSLAGQTDIDFEVLVIGHRLSEAQQKQVERLIDDNPEWLRVKTRLIRVEDGNRTRPLNVGFDQASGDYIAILDDDDAPFAHWVETFKEMALVSPGRVLRANALRQDVVNVSVGGKPGLKASGPPLKLWPSTFDLFAHFQVNQTPPIAVAFPRGVFHDLNVRFDEALTTTEDWDYIVRAALLVGVASSDKVTGLYRWWVADESSRVVHSAEEWQHNHRTIWMKLDHGASLMPSGSVGRIRKLLDDQGELQGRVGYLESRLRDHGIDFEDHRSAKNDNAYAKTLDELLALLNSTSWRVSYPLRLMGHILGKPDKALTLGQMSTDELKQAVASIKASTSWRSTRHLRRMKGSSK